MPIVDIEPLVPGVRIDTPRGMALTPGALGEDEPVEPERPGFLDALEAHFSIDNLIASTAGSEAWRAPERADPDFDAWSEISGTDREQYWERYVDVRNRAQFDAVTHDIDTEEETRRIIDATPWYQSVPMMLLANVTDPTMLIPGGAFVRGVKGGLSVARSAMNVGLATGAAVSVQEAGLQATQQLRTAGESGVAIGASVLLGGLLGAGGARLLSRAEWRQMVTTLDREINDPAIVQDNTPFPAPVGAAVGAQVAPGPDIDALTIAGRAAGLTARATRLLNPNLRLAHVSSPVARDVAANLTEMTHYIKGNDMEMASPLAVETLIKEWNAGLMKAVDFTRNSFSEYRKRAVGPANARARETVEHWLGRGNGTLDRSEFAEAVGRALAENDEHAIPEVANAAKAWRANVIDPLLKEAQALGIFPDDITVETAPSYFMRMWNRKRLIGEEHIFKDTVREWFMSQAPRWISEFEADATARIARAGDDEITRVRAEIEAERAERFEDIPGRANELTDEVYDKLTGRQGSSIRPYHVTVDARGPLKGRTFLIPDRLVEPWLERNVDIVGRQYHRIMASEIELRRKFPQENPQSPILHDQLETIKEDYRKLRTQTADGKQLARLTKEEKVVRDDLLGLVDVIRGTYGFDDWQTNFGAIVRVANMNNYARSMGQVSLASLPEGYRIAMVHGLRPFMSTLGKAITHPQAFKMAVREAKLGGNIGERVLGSKTASLADITNFFSSRGPIENFMANMVELASRWNGIRLWTDGSKMIGAVSVQNQLLDFATNWATTALNNRRYMRFLGINEPMAQRITRQFAEHGETSGGVRIANTERWTDTQARRTYYAAMNKDLDTVVTTKGAGDLPLLANKPLGKMILQFNTFNIASHQRVLINGLQGNQARFVQSVIAMTTLGMLVTWLKAKATNRDVPDLFENPGWWLSEGLDHSGIFMVPMQLANMMEMAVGINPVKAPFRAFDETAQQSLKLHNRGPFSLLGPSSQLANDIWTAAHIPIGLAARGEMTEGQKNAAERLLPYNTYAGWRQMLRYIVNPPD